MKFHQFFVLCILFVVVSGCASVSSSVSPDFDPNSYKKFYVVPESDDERGLNIIIRDELVARGYAASAGPAEGIPDDSQVKVSYESKWMWDITWYLFDLVIYFKEPQTDVLLASGHSHHPSLTRISPEKMVNEILDKLFGTSGQE
jgi:hypothetical protein